MFITLSFSLPFYGQNKQVVDSLLQITESDITDQERVDTYILIAFEHVGSDSTGANRYIEKALNIAESIGYDEGRMDALYVQGRSALLSGEYNRAEKYLSQLLSASNDIDYKKGIANAYYSKAWLNYYQGNYAKSIDFHLRSLDIRNTLASKVDISDCLRGLGITYKLLGEFDRALGYLNQSLEIEEAINNPGGIAATLNHIGIINSLRGDYSVAMDIYYQALVIEQKLDDKSGLAYTYQNIGVIHDLQNDYEKALDFYSRSLKLRQEIGEKRGVAQIINNIGLVYHAQKNYERAYEYYQDALQKKEELGDRRGVADGHLNIGKLLTDQGKHAQAISNKKKALSISEEMNSDWGRVQAMISLGRSYRDLSRFNEAKKYLKEGIGLATEAKLIEDVKEGARLLASVEESLGHYSDAYRAQILFQKMSDSISSAEVAKRITLLEAQFEFQQEKDSLQFANEKERLLLDQRIKTQKTTQFMGIAVVFVLILVIGVLSRYYRLKAVSNKRLSLLNREIQSRNESLSALNDEKNNLISIVAHDLQNPLSGIMGALDLMESKELKEEHKTLKDIIHISATRMSKMISDILNIESIEEGVEQMNVQPFNISKTVGDVCSQFSKRAADKGINIVTEIAPEVIALVDEKYEVQIIENLLSNAIKFSPRDKQIEVHLSKKNGKSLLEVKDQGPGLNEQDKKKLFKKFQKLSAKPTGDESSTGLGLSIVKKFVERMGGEIWCESEAGQGASFFVELRLAEEQS